MNTRITTLVAAALLVMSTAACRRGRPSEGPIERAGKQVDNAAEKTKDVSKDVAKETKEGAKDVKKEVKKDVK